MTFGSILVVFPSGMGKSNPLLAILSNENPVSLSINILQNKLEDKVMIKFCGYAVEKNEKKTEHKQFHMNIFVHAV